MNWPKISIVTPSFNQGLFIEQTIKSVINQRYPNLEYIIMDGGSTDGTMEIIKKYESHIAHWESAPDKGQSDAIGKGFAHATGDIIAWINSDDVYFPSALEKVAKAYLANTEASIYAGGLAIGNMTGTITKCSIPSPLKKKYFQCGILGVGQPSSFFNTKFYRQISGVAVNLYMRMDNDLMFRLLQCNRKAVIIPYILSFFRWQPQSKSTLSLGRYNAECLNFTNSINMKEGEIKFRAMLFKISRLISGGYLKSIIATYLYSGKNIADIWNGEI